MIVETLKNLDIQRVGDLEDGIKAGISQESLPFIFELVSKQLYSNPIGSVIREITSNCFDSHIEAGVDEPVIISKTYDPDEGYAIEFKDVGMGISPERMETIYVNYFSSTKRGDNTQIGGFGIGSKTPLAYADLFYIITIYEGTKYSYIFHRGEDKPMLETLSVEETTEHNGTTIKIIMDGNDNYVFSSELRTQLAYFDNVYFKGWNINNEYDIYEGKHFKYRSDIGTGTILHICIGKVRYSLDFSKVEIPKVYRDLPIAVKFEVGELQVTPSRETLRYTDSAIELIKNRIEQAIQELVSIFGKQNPVLEDLESFTNANREVPRITFNESKEHYLYLKSGIEGISKNYRFKPLEGIGINKIPQNMFFMWDCIGTIKYGVKESSYFLSVDNDFILRKSYLIIDDEDRDSKYTCLKIAETHTIVYLIKRRRVTTEFPSIISSLGINKSTLGKAGIVSKYLQITDNIVTSKGQSYSDFKASPEWIRDYKKSLKEKSKDFLRKQAKKVFVRDIVTAQGFDVSLDELKRNKGIVIYGLKEDYKILENIARCVPFVRHSLYVKGNNGAKRRRKIMVLQIAQAVEIALVKLNNNKIIYCKDFFNTRFFRKISTSYYIHQRVKEIDLEGTHFRKKFLKDYEEDWNTVINSISKDGIDPFYNYPYTLKEYETQEPIPEMLEPLNKFIAKHSYYIPLIKHLDTYAARDPISAGELVSYLKSLKLRLKNEYYLINKIKQND